MRDSLLVFAAACGAGLIAWPFWRFEGEAAYFLFGALVTAALFADNIRLRRKMNKDGRTDDGV